MSFYRSTDRRADDGCRSTFGNVVESKEAQGVHRLSFVHRATALRTTAARPRRTAQGRRVRRCDDVYDDGARLQLVRVYGHGIVGVHAESRSVDDYVASVWVGCAKSCAAAGRLCDGLSKAHSTTLVNVEYGKRTRAGGRDGKRDGTAGAAGADQKNRFVRRVITFPLHAETQPRPSNVAPTQRPLSSQRTILTAPT